MYDVIAQKSKLVDRLSLVSGQLVERAEYEPSSTIPN
jgi:hypothetical protein